jgi:hypothetical protein
MLSTFIMSSKSKEEWQLENLPVSCRLTSSALLLSTTRDIFKLRNQLLGQAGGTDLKSKSLAVFPLSCLKKQAAVPIDLRLPCYPLEAKVICSTNLKWNLSIVTQYIFMTGCLGTKPHHDLGSIRKTIKAIRDVSSKKFELGDSDYVRLFLDFFPMFDGCFLLQTSD